MMGGLTVQFLAAFAFFVGKPFRRLARHYGFMAEELDFILNYDTRLRRGFGGQVKPRLSRDIESKEE